MKKLMIALALLGITGAGATAQAQTCHHKKMRTAKVAHVKHTSGKASFGNAYQVCREQGGYYTCCVYKKNNNTVKSW